MVMLEKSICMSSETAVKYYQEIYAVVSEAIQSERIFLQHVTKNKRYSFTGVEKLPRETFLPCLFFRKYKYLPSIVGTLSKFLVKKSGLGLQNSVTSSKEIFLSLWHASIELIRDVKRERKFSTSDHLQAVKEERSDVIKTKDDFNKAELEVIFDTLNAFYCRIFLRAKQTGSWMTVRSTTVTSTVISAMEFCDFFCVRYNVTPLSP